MTKIIIKYILLLSVVLFGFQTMAQKIISGVVSDLDNMTLIGAHIHLIENDTTINTSTTTDVDGRFILQTKLLGDFKLKISYLGYKDLLKEIRILKNKNKYDLDTIRLNDSDVKLEGVNVVAKRIPMQIKGDTTQFDPKAYSNSPNESIAELLEKLPGVTADSEGNIMINGKKVDKIMVNGKDFFSNDPKTALDALNSNVIKHIQMFEKSSDKSRFTGLEDLDKEMTINFELDDKSINIFGNVQSRGGTNNRYRTSGNLSVFKKKTQLTLMGSKVNSNTGTGLSVSENFGANVNTDLSNDYQLNFSYNHAGADNSTESESERSTFVEDNIFRRQSNSESKSGNKSNSLNVSLNKKFNKKEYYTLRASLKRGKSNSDRISSSSTMGSDEQLLNRSFSENNNERKNYLWSTALSYFRSVGEKGNMINSSFVINNNSNESHSDVNSKSEYFSDDTLPSAILNQYQPTKIGNLNMSGEIGYLHKFKQDLFLNFAYSFKNNKGNTDKDFFNISEEDSLIRDNELSTKYDRLYFAHLLGFTFNVRSKSSNLSMGLNVQNSKLEGSKTGEFDLLKKSYLYFLPEVSWSKKQESGHLSLSYRTSISEPRLEQINPVVDNTNPLHIRMGNPDLKPAYSHRFSYSYKTINPENFAFFNIGTGFTYTHNKILNSQTIDKYSVQTSKPINVDDEFRFNMRINAQMPLDFIKSKIGVGGGITVSQSEIFLNNIQTDTRRFNNSLNLTLENSTKKILDVRCGIQYSGNIIQYSDNEDMAQNYDSYAYKADFSWNITKKWRVKSNYRLSSRKGNTFGKKINTHNLSADISRTLFKRKGEIKLLAYDMLSKDQGINRSSGLNYVEEKKYKPIGRYYMLMLRYKIGRA